MKMYIVVIRYILIFHYDTLLFSCVAYCVVLIYM